MKYKISALCSIYIGTDHIFFSETLESLRAQSHQADEIIIIKDGPLTMKTEEVIDKYLKILPINIFAINKTECVGIAYNFGVSKCSNEIIAIVDSDDINRKDRFKNQINILNKNKVDLVSGHISEFCSKPGDLSSLKKTALSILDYNKHVCFRNPINNATTMFYKSSLIKAGGYLHHPYMEDYNLWIRMFSLINFKYLGIDEVLVDVRVGDNSMFSRRRGFKYINSEFQLFLLKIKHLNNNFIIIFTSFLLRSIPRILPVFILKIIYYKYLRNN